MIKRPDYLDLLKTAVRRSPITALMGARQTGKTTLVRMFTENKPATFFDLESIPDQRRLQNPELVLRTLEGLVILDEIQLMPELFGTLRVLVDRPGQKTRFIILGSASPEIIRNASETLAGRIEFVDLNGFNLAEVGSANWELLWIRGGFPRSFLAGGEAELLDLAGRIYPHLPGAGHSAAWHSNSCHFNAALLDDVGPLSRPNLECIRARPCDGAVG